MTKKEKNNLLLFAGAGAALFAYSQYKKAQNMEFIPGSISNFKLSVLNNQISFNIELGLKNTTDLKLKINDLKGNVYINNVYIASYQLISNVDIPALKTKYLNITFQVPLSSILSASAGVLEAIQAGEGVVIDLNYIASTNYGKFENTIKYTT